MLKFGFSCSYHKSPAWNTLYIYIRWFSKCKLYNTYDVRSNRKKVSKYKSINQIQHHTVNYSCTTLFCFEYPEFYCTIPVNLYCCLCIACIFFFLIIYQFLGHFTCLYLLPGSWLMNCLICCNMWIWIIPRLFTKHLV